ncbi:uncharacterized protein LOC125212613 [Salvia hispanica]|uniref:uncharacterized protein LOC125212613 n=1 Tax=Salvia hispanica TaxID=49212 RepID=UPI002009A8F5|nr:uncharacterized protein LOC125212613 [Salvia hispanica]
MSPNQEVFSRQMCPRQNSIQNQTRVNPTARRQLGHISTFGDPYEYEDTSDEDEDASDDDRKLAIENFHKHHLVLVGEKEEDHNYKCKKLVCDMNAHFSHKNTQWAYRRHTSSPPRIATAATSSVHTPLKR